MHLGWPYRSAEEMKPEGWGVPFDDAIPVPGGSQIKTLRDAGEYIHALPRRTQQLPQWQQATKDLIIAADVDRAWRYFARISVYRAIHGDKPSKPLPPRKSDVFKEKRAAYKKARAAPR